MTAKPSRDKNTRLAQVYVKGTSIHVEVSTTWYVHRCTKLFINAGPKTFFSPHLSIAQVLCRFWLSEHKIHSSKENKMLPKQILTLRPVGSPMRLVFTQWQPTFHSWLPTWPPRYVTFFGKTYTNNDQFSVRN